MTFKKRRILSEVSSWEFWPMWTLYLPLIPLWIYYALRSGKIRWYQDANPSIPGGGLFQTSKWQIQGKFAEQFLPATLLINPLSDTIWILQQMKTAGISFPCVAKPDAGCRGKGVVLIHDPEALGQYVLHSKKPFLLQAYISYELEAGVFVVLNPITHSFHITGITSKEFLTVHGTGDKTLQELMEKDSRAKRQINRLKETLDLGYVPKQGERVCLENIGNHNRGTCFRDSSKRISPALESVFADLLQGRNLYYGRFDIRFRSWELLEQGKDFKIIEFNGAMSEPTHMYDPERSYWMALQELYIHHRFLFAVSGYIRKQRQV